MTVSKHSCIAATALLWLASLIFVIHGKTLAEDQSFKSSMGNINIIPICTIKGDYFTSNYVGQVVRTRGGVFADLDSTSNKGFFIQQNDCDGDPATSDGIFIDLGEKQEVVNAGDNVEVQGVVLEDYSNTEIIVITGTVTITIDWR
jgi:predicted extracellular nuclease